MSKVTPERRSALLNQAAGEMVRAQFVYLARRFGVNQEPRGWWWYHNATHGIRVAWQAARGAARQVELGRLPPDAVPAAMIAGIFHDHIQAVPEAGELAFARVDLPGIAQTPDLYEWVILNQLTYRIQRDSAWAGQRLDAGESYAVDPRREALSVQAAHGAMRRFEETHGLKPGELFGELCYSWMAEGVGGTAVRSVSTDGVETMASDASDLFAKVISDADASDFGMRGGLYRGPVGFALEVNQGFPDRDATVQYLRFQEQLNRNHPFELSESKELYPHQSWVADQAGYLLHEFEAGRMDWPQMLAYAAPALFEEPPPPRGASSPLITDPSDIVPDLAPALRGLAPGVGQPIPPLDPALRTAKDIAGIPYDTAVVLGPAGPATATRKRPGTAFGR